MLLDFNSAYYFFSLRNKKNTKNMALFLPIKFFRNVIYKHEDW